MKIQTDLLLPVMVLLTGSSQADDLQLTPDIRLSERYEDNLTLQFSGHERATLVSSISPSLSMLYRQENQQLNASFRWNQLYYHEEPAFDFAEKTANVKYNFSGERYLIDLNTGYLIQSSVNTQLEQEGSGNLQLRVPMTTRSASPGFTYFFDESNSLRLGYDYSDVSFEQNISSNVNQSYSDYNNQQFSANYFHTLNEVLRLNFLLAYSQYRSSGDMANSLANFDARIPGTNLTFQVPLQARNSFSQESDMFLYQAGGEYSFDELTKLSVSAGIRNTDTTSTNISRIPDGFTTADNFLISRSNTSVFSSSTSGHVFSGSLNRTTEWGSVLLSAAQQINPASTGSQQSTTTFSGVLRYNLDERWSASLNGTYLMSESVSNFNGLNGASNRSNNRTYMNITPSIRWRLTPDMNWDLIYTHRSQEYSVQKDTAYGNTIQLQFSYQPQINSLVK